MDKFQEQFAIPKLNKHQIRIGLTGGIASGKSTVAKFLEDSMQLPILDADIYSHEVLSTNLFLRDNLIERYGNQITQKKLTSEKSIDRKILAKIIFEDKEERFWLESKLHPIIKRRFLEEINTHTKSPILILVIPLLFEANFTDICTHTWLVHCRLHQQEKRLMKRDSLSKKEALQRIKSQID